jgi:hypothetical protein
LPPVDKEVDKMQGIFLIAPGGKIVVVKLINGYDAVDVPNDLIGGLITGVVVLRFST